LGGVLGDLFEYSGQILPERGTVLSWPPSATYDVSQFALQFANRLRRVFSV